MENSPELKGIIELVQGTGSIATVVIVYLAIRLKEAVTKYLETLQETIEELKKTQQQHAEEISLLKSAFFTPPIRGQFRPHDRRRVGTGEDGDT